MIPAYLREGHRYYIEVDNIGEHFIYKPIAVFFGAVTLEMGHEVCEVVGVTAATQFHRRDRYHKHGTIDFGIA
ncbi:hypothetical protein Y032_0530g3007 [Ancylostoma ceylanicum]|uniref:Uncharacterized protein n=1 Tax=Ancylostoma ceylanicum TaxID=53326 RepID=A0A016WRR1_9BILA|nr:hypothetical protein Y032_0530g3007 [Ancylostoma ceylanicum]